MATDHPRRLQTIAAEYEAAKSAHARADRRRTAAIKAAHKTGLTVRQIAEHLSVSYQLVGRLLKR